jgi:hypothetical protein
MIPPYLDKNHPNFSTELFLAVMAWMDLFNDANKKLPNITVEEMFIKWVNEHKDEIKIEITESDIEEIAINITPDRIQDRR